MINLQTVAGNWKLNSDLVTAVNARNVNSVTDARNVIRPAISRVISSRYSANDDTVATVMALATLRRYSSQQSQLSSINRKAIDFLITQPGLTRSNIEQVITAAAEALSF